MGYRSTLTTQHYNYDGDLPQWFKEKYNNYFLFPNGTLVSCTEFKMYSGNDFFEDYQKALIELNILTNNFKVICAVLAEDGKITKVIINKDEIKYVIMEDGCELDGVCSYWII